MSKMAASSSYPSDLESTFRCHTATVLLSVLPLLAYSTTAPLRHADAAPQSIARQSLESGFITKHPKVGDTVELAYNPQLPEAVLKDASAVDAEVHVMRAKQFGASGAAFAVPLRQDGHLWRGSFRLEDPYAQALLVRFASPTTVDTNNKDTWRTMVYGPDEKPVRNALLQLSATYYGALAMQGFPTGTDRSEEQRLLREELALYPGNLEAHIKQYAYQRSVQPGTTTKERIRKELVALDARTTGADRDDLGLNSLAREYRSLGMMDEAERTIAEARKRYPNGYTDSNDLLGKIQAAKGDDRLRLLEDTIAARKPADPFRKRFVEQLADAYAKTGQWDAAVALLGTKTPDGRTVYRLAKTAESQGRHERMISLLQQAVPLLIKADPIHNTIGMAPRVWREQHDEYLSLAATPLITEYQQQGRLTDALTLADELYTSFKGKDQAVNHQLTELLIATNDTRRALQVATDAITTGHAGTELIPAFRNAYTKEHGSNQGFDTFLAQLRNKARTARRDEFQNALLHEKSIPFALPNLDGTIVQSADLKGKIVILDFWATWCGPCKASFPYLQQIYDKYKDNQNVRVYAVDTAEQDEPATIDRTVREYITKQGYTFPVLLSTEQDLSSAYGFDAIPSRVVIDQQGIVRFKDTGFNGGEDFVNTITAQLEILLDKK